LVPKAQKAPVTAMVIPSQIDEAVIAAAGARISSGAQYHQSQIVQDKPAEPPKPVMAAELESSTLDLTSPESLESVELEKSHGVSEPEPVAELLLEDSLDQDAQAELGEAQAVSLMAEPTKVAQASEFELTASAVEVAQIVEVESIAEAGGPDDEPRTQTLVQTSPLEPLGESEDSLAQAFEESQAGAVFKAPAEALAPEPSKPEALLAAKAMSILEGRGGVLKASQTQMSTPIQIDHTQLPRVMKETQAVAQSSGNLPVTVTVQELEASYQKNIFLNSLEIVYYKLLRAAFTQFLIFPKVTSRAAVTVISKNPDHLKVAENVLSNTTISFVVCDVKLNIRAVVEIVDDQEPPTNKDRARDYILKKAGLMIVRFYSGDTQPDVSTLRKLLSD
jgi:hypothetical protein